MTYESIIDNPLVHSDSYKYSQYLQLPPNSEDSSTYVESRGGRYPQTVVFGNQALVKSRFMKPITRQHVEEAHELLTEHGEPFNYDGFMKIVRKYGGYMPLRIEAVAEGSVVPTGNTLLRVRPTDSEFVWLPGFWETEILRGTWYPTTVATYSWHIKKIIKRYLEKTGTPELIDFKLHDFGARGVSSRESAGLGGLAHLVNFKGTDTVSALAYGRAFYNCRMAGYSIPASEHSTMTSWGGREGEVAAMNNMLQQFTKPGQLVACVSDSYDIMNACLNIWGGVLKEKVLQLHAIGGKLVVRPDSGDPVEITLQVVEALASRFGFTTNSKGYKVLHPAVGIIQGDGIDEAMVEKILANYEKHGWSADNITFGSGGKLLQAHTRDDQKFAMKMSAIKVDNEWRDVFKDPITDPGKKSKRGILTLERNIHSGNYRTVSDSQEIKGSDGWYNAMLPIYDTGEMFNEVAFDQVRANAEAGGI